MKNKNDKTNINKVGQKLKDNMGFEFIIIEFDSYAPNGYNIRYLDDNSIYFRTEAQLGQTPRERKFPYYINNIKIKKLAYKYKNICNFYCTCTKCGYKDIMTMEEIKQHNCEDITCVE